MTAPNTSIMDTDTIRTTPFTQNLGLRPSTFGRKWAFILISVVVVVVTGSCSREVEDLDRPVASWNDIHIYADHFIKEYELFGTYSPARDLPETREFYARIMLEREIIAQQGRAAGLDTLPIVRQTIRRRTEMARRRHLFNTEVRPTVTEPTEQDIETAFRRSNTRVRAAQIFASTREQIDSLSVLLAQGLPFEELAEASMVAAGQTPGSNGLMGWVTFNQLDEAPESALFTLKQNEVSEPVESLIGYHIFKALDVEETVFFDQSTFNNQRDNLRHQVFQRRYDEATARFIRQEVMSEELAVDMQALFQAYQELSPILPQQPRPEEIIRYNAELNFLEPELRADTPLAFVNGEPFTYGQFLYQLPDIPVEWVVSDFRHALEIAIRDSILAARSERVRPDTARDVRTQTRIAEYTALYYATLQQGVDTLNAAPLIDDYYDIWKAEQFFVSQTTSWNEYRFADSTSATRVIEAYSAGNDIQTALQASGATFSTEQRQLSTQVDSTHRVHGLPLQLANGREVLTGPFNDSGAWILLHPTDRQTFYKPLDEVRDDVLKLIEDRKLRVAHEQLLPAEYHPDDVVVNTALLDRIMPYYY